MQPDLQALSIQELRMEWSKMWGMEPHNRIGRAMLTKSIEFKQREYDLTPKQQARLKQIIESYPRRRTNNHKNSPLKPGTRLERIYQGRKHYVLVTRDGYEYQGTQYNSLSKIANQITGSRWNGWVFFGLRKQSAQ